MASYEVSLLPSRHQFQASSQQTLLQAGLESGLKLRYGCEGGNCGECLARLVKGQIKTLRHSDFILSPQQKSDQFFLSCCHAADSDCQIEVSEIGSVNEIPKQRIEARVYKLEAFQHDVLSVAFKTPRSQPLSFFAGQYVTVELDNGLTRNKSIASCPCDGLKPEIHVKYRPGDEFSEYMFHQLIKNDRVLIKGPGGDFVLDDDSNRDIIFIAYDTGFASIKSLLEHAIALEMEQAVKLYWIVTPNNSPYLENYCRAIEDALDNFVYYPFAIKEASEKCIQAVLKKILAQEPAIKHSDVFITLPDNFRKIAQSLLVNVGLDERHWRIDSLVRL